MLKLYAKVFNLKCILPFGVGLVISTIPSFFCLHFRNLVMSLGLRICNQLELVMQAFMFERQFSSSGFGRCFFRWRGWFISLLLRVSYPGEPEWELSRDEGLSMSHGKDSWQGLEGGWADRLLVFVGCRKCLGRHTSSPLLLLFSDPSSSPPPSRDSTLRSTSLVLCARAALDTTGLVPIRACMCLYHRKAAWTRSAQENVSRLSSI